MTLFNPGGQAEFIATQNFHYDNYSGRQYQLTRVEVEGKYGLACTKELEEGINREKILLHPHYLDIQIHRISTPKANYDR